MQDQESKLIAALLERLMHEPCWPFPAPGVSLIASAQRGVYIIYSPEDEVLHVGSTPRGRDGLAQRLRNHLAGKSSFTRAKFDGDGSQLRNGCKFRCLVIENGRQRALVEALGIGRLCPEHLGSGLDTSDRRWTLDELEQGLDQQEMS
jgi:hypothetical protein